MFDSKLRRLLVLFAALSLTLGMAACGSDDDPPSTTDTTPTDVTPTPTDGTPTPTDGTPTPTPTNGTPTPTPTNGTPTPTPTPAPDFAEFHFVHLAPGAPDVELRFAETEEVITEDGAIGFGAFLEIPFEVPSGTYNIEVLVGDDVIDTVELEVTAPGTYSIAAILDAEGEVTFLVAEDDYSLADRDELASNNETRLTGIHAAAGVPAIDVYLREVGSTDAPVLLFEDVEFGARSESADADAARYEILVDVGRNGDFEYVFIPAAPLTAGFITNAYVILEDGMPMIYAHVLNGPLVLPVAPATGDLRILHAAENAGAVDVWIDGVQPEADSPLAGIDFSDATDYLSVLAGTRTIELYAAGEDDAAVFSFDPFVAPGLVATAIAHGDASDENTDAALGFTISVLGDDTAELDEDDTRLVIFHAAFGAGEATVSAESDPDPVVLVEDLAYAASDSVDVETALYNLTLAVDGSEILFTADLDGLEGTLVYAVATFDDEGDVVLLLLWENADGESVTAILEEVPPI